MSTTTTLPISDRPITFADQEIFREKRSPNPIAHAIFGVAQAIVFVTQAIFSVAQATQKIA